MPRVHLSISTELYDQLQRDAKQENITVNHLVLSILQEKYDTPCGIDYIALLNQMILESQEVTGDFVLADLPTYSGVREMLDGKKSNISAASVRARLGKMYNEAVRTDAVPYVKRAVIEHEGSSELKFLARAAVYTKLMSRKQND